MELLQHLCILYKKQTVLRENIVTPRGVFTKQISMRELNSTADECRDYFLNGPKDGHSCCHSSA